MLSYKQWLNESLITTNSLGDPIHPTKEGIKNFWKWFGDSKCVDDQGRPLVYYHTTTKDFNEFKVGAKDGLSGKGIYFSDYPLQQYGGRLMKVYLKISNPITQKTEIDGMREINSSGIPTKMIPDVLEKFSQFDGIMNRSEIVVKHPSQIKSVDNNGSFNSTSNIITESKYTRDQLERMEWDDLTKLAYGVKTGDIITLNPNEIKIKYKDDLENPKAIYSCEIKKNGRCGMEWVKSVSFEEPLKVSLGIDGKSTKEDWYLEDGHHRLFAAKKLKMKTIKCEVEEINLKAIEKLLKD